MSKKSIIGIILAFSVLSVPLHAGAQNPDTATIQQLQEQVQALLAQVQVLQEELAQLHGEQSDLKEEIQGLRLETKQLRQGVRGKNVKLVQEILSTDPEIYPEGLITGYFGPLTEQAVKRFQKKFGIEQAGEVGPQTRAKINALLKSGAGKSGKVPPGLLIAPGILKKLGEAPTIPEGQKLPRGIAKKLGLPTDPDDDDTPSNTTAPEISDLSASSTTATSTTITWTTSKEANGTVWYDTITPVTTANSTPSMSHADFTLNHSLELSGLTASTTYFYIAVSEDSAENSTTSTEQSFTTLSE